ncbi:PREDICTED: histone H2A [Chinchilla lanigera]|uniref:histone H2A n=1 Tax=Chinchilla lanigera TaxID=34839 RepID=UPI000698EF8C|nr:PREDICTED: histone H2A [Chinchilla lanigera]
MAGKKSRRKSHKSRRQAVSRSSRAELQFPVSPVERHLRQGGYAPRLSSTTAVFLAGILEYLTANILVVAGKEAQDKLKKRITPQHLEVAMERIEQLQNLLGDITKSLRDEMAQAEKK